MDENDCKTGKRQAFILGQDSKYILSFIDGESSSITKIRC